MTVAEKAAINDPENDRDLKKAERQVVKLRALKPKMHELIRTAYKLAPDASPEPALKLLLRAAAALSDNFQTFRKQADKAFFRVDSERNWESICEGIEWPPQHKEAK